MARTQFPKSLLAALAASLLLTGCITPRSNAPATRDTPEGTVEMFKLFARRGDPSGEWDVLSPTLKRRLSQRAGRQVSIDDYIQARTALRGDARVALAEQVLQTAIVRRVEMVGTDLANVTIETSGGPLSRTATIRMVRLERWQLFVHGQEEPYWGHRGDALFGADRQADGSFVVWYRDQPGGEAMRQPIPAGEVQNYRTEWRWYVDDLGALEAEFFN